MRRYLKKLGVSKAEIKKIIKILGDNVDVEDIEEALKTYSFNEISEFIIAVGNKDKATFDFFGSGDFTYYLRAYVISSIDEVINLLRYQKTPEDCNEEQSNNAKLLQAKLDENEGSGSENSEDETSDDQSSDKSEDQDLPASKDAKGLGYVSNSSEYSLLSDDYTSGEEAILGESFNFPYNNKFIPGNKIHKQLAWYENAYREKFYTQHNGESRYNTSFVKYYKNIKARAAQKQDKMGSSKDKRKQKFGDPKDYEHDKAHKLKDCMGMPYILTIKPDSDSIKVYPNFGVAKLSYITNNRMHSKCVVARQKKFDGHSEDQIFQQVLDNIKSGSKYKNAALLVLDIHTALSMCQSRRNSCYQKAHSFIKTVEELIGKYKVLVRVSYNFPYSLSVVQKGDGNTLLQKQIEIPQSPTTSKSFKVNSVIISSGYKQSKKQKEAIDAVDKIFIQQMMEKGFTLYHKDKVEMTIPEGFIDVDRDGLCFYHALAQQLDNTRTALELQGMAINEILSNLDRYKAFFMIPENNYDHMNPLGAVEAYFNYHLRSYDRAGDNAWADQLMIQAVVNALGVNIEVHMFNLNGTAQIHEEGAHEGEDVVLSFTPLNAQGVNTLVIGNVDNLHFVAQECIGLAVMMTWLDVAS